MANLSEHFTLEELTRSETAARLGINNQPSQALLDHAKAILLPGIEKVRAMLGHPMHISSGYRSVALNAAVPGSSNTSQHTKFEAIDFTCPEFGDLITVIKAIVKSGIKFDQIIHEYGAWVHISFAEKPRGHLLSKFKGEPYKEGIWTTTGEKVL